MVVVVDFLFCISSSRSVGVCNVHAAVRRVTVFNRINIGGDCARSLIILPKATKAFKISNKKESLCDLCECIK